MLPNETTQQLLSTPFISGHQEFFPWSVDIIFVEPMQLPLVYADASRPCLDSRYLPRNTLFPDSSILNELLPTEPTAIHKMISSFQGTHERIFEICIATHSTELRSIVVAFPSWFHTWSLRPFQRITGEMDSEWVRLSSQQRLEARVFTGKISSSYFQWYIRRRSAYLSVSRLRVMLASIRLRRCPG